MNTFKKLCGVVLALVLVLSVCCPLTAFANGSDLDFDVSEYEYDPCTYTIPQMEGYYKTYGRSAIVNDMLFSEYSAGGIEFEAYCMDDVYVTFNTTYLTFTQPQNGCYYTVYVDGVKQPRSTCQITQLGDSTIKIASSLPLGNHRFEIYRQNEIEYATIGIKSVTVAGELKPSPANKDLYIEFIGDSITTGYSNLATNSVSNEEGPYSVYQDVTQAYSFLTARALNADFSIIAQQGRGAKYGYTTANMQDIYPKLRYHKDQNTNYDFARQPDYVVIALGTNDMYTYENRHSATLADVKQGFAEMLALVRQKNPNANIIWAYNMMVNTANSIITEVINEAGGADAGYYSVMLTRNTAGGKGHPDTAGHAVMATELSAFITEVEKSLNASAGNVNGDADGKVDLDDVVALAQIVAGWQNVQQDENALDVNGDGDVTLDDVVLLAQYVAGWDVEIHYTRPTPGGGSGDDNTGDDNTGDDNTGDDNTGDDNTGGDNNDDNDDTQGDNNGDVDIDVGDAFFN